MAATNAQVQQFSDERVRPLCQLIRDLLERIDDWNATFGDVYANLTNAPTWTDTRADAPPSKLGPNDILAINTYIVNLDKANHNNSPDLAALAAQLPIVLKAVVRPPLLG